MSGKRLYPAKLEAMLKEWYGDDEGAAAIEQHLPRPKSLAEVLDKFAARKIPAGKLKIAEVQEHWAEIAGPETVRRAFPLFLNEGILYIEVGHPAYRAALESKQIKAKLLEKIQAYTGEQYCRELKFIPVGRREKTPPSENTK